MNRFWTMAGAAMIACGVVSIVQAQPIRECPVRYEWVEINSTALGIPSWSIGIRDLNDDGEVVGIGLTVQHKGQGFVWTAQDGMRIVAEDHAPSEINNAGVMAGEDGGNADTSTLYISDRDGLLGSFEVPAVNNAFYISDVTESGWVVGTIGDLPDSTGAATRYRAWRMRVGDTALEILDLPAIAVESYAATVGANEDGSVIGWVSHPDLECVPIVWGVDGTPAELLDRGVLIGRVEPLAVSDSGDILMYTSDGPAIWSESVGLRLLGDPLVNAAFLWAWCINDLGHVGGSSSGENTWIAIDGIYSMLQPALVDDPGIALVAIDHINDAGQMIARGRFEIWMRHYLLTPVGVCAADVSTTGAPSGGLGHGVPDGEIGGSDLSFFVNGWVVGDSLADMTTRGAGDGDALYGEPDGLVTGADIQYYVNMWISGCAQ